MSSETSQTAIPSAVTNSRFEPAYRVLSSAIEARAFPGCAFGVLAKGEIVLQDALGSFTFEPNAPSVKPDTIYDIASITKVLATTTAAMLLNQRGRLDLEMPLGDLLPGFVVGRAPGDGARHVKLRHLLAHNSGLPGYVEFFRTATTASALFSALLDLPLEAAPGERTEYSDPGFMLLGKALEVCTGEGLASWVTREVFEQLGLTATSFCPRTAIWPSIPPTEEDGQFRQRRIQGEVQDENAWVLNGVAGHAGVFSDVPDLLRFAGEILDAVSVTRTSRLFAADTVWRFAEKQGPDGSSRALGWDTPSANSSSGRHFSSKSIGHLGYSGCSLWIDLNAQVAMALLTNRTWPDRKNQSIREVRPAFHDAVLQAL